MELGVRIALSLAGGALLLGFGSFAWRAIRQCERRAARAGLIIGIASSLPFFLALFLPLSAKLAIASLVAAAVLAVALLLLAPIGRVAVQRETPASRFDERDMVFARALMEPGSERYEAYYARRPELRAVDERIRALPGLLSLQAKEARPLPFASAMASFAYIAGCLRGQAEGEFVAAHPELSRIAHEISPEERTAWIKRLALYYGARGVGIAALRDYHLYSHIGRGAGIHGAPIELPHTHAIAITVEIANEMVQQGPGAATVMESAKEYADAAHIALQLTTLLRLLGYSARAHIDGNYRVICPLVARDAGLGEIGRFGFLITPELGPRVRLAVVTTDMPLRVDVYTPDAAVIDFCTVCTKCADICPAQAIPRGERKRHDGALRWRIDANACFRYWNIVGTDCGRCMAVCPYSHAALYHPAPVRWLVRRSGFARRAMLWLDNLLYGRKPKPHPSFPAPAGG